MGYAALWNEANIGQVTSELALLAQGLARVNQEQYGALAQLFRWLKR